MANLLLPTNTSSKSASRRSSHINTNPQAPQTFTSVGNAAKITEMFRIGGKSKSKRVKTDQFGYEEVNSCEVLGLEISKDRLLLCSRGSPEFYTVSYTGCKTVEVTIVDNTNSLQIRPSTLTLSKQSPKAEIQITYTTTKIASELTLKHSTSQSEKLQYYPLRVCIIHSTGLSLRTTGNDDHHQLGHLSTLERFKLRQHLVERNEVPANAISRLRPMPEGVGFEGEGEAEAEMEPKWNSISVGEMHSLACTHEGEVYSWGSGYFGQLGIPIHAIKDFQQANQLSSFQISQIRRKNSHDYSIYAFDLHNYKDSLEDTLDGHASFKPILCTPTKLLTFTEKIISVVCGHFHSLFLDPQGFAYSCGLGSNGRLGNGSEQNIETPFKIPGLPFISGITAGYNTSFFLTTQNEAYSCGACSKNGNGHPTDICTPTLIPFLPPVHQLSSSASHTGATTLDGSIILFGSNTDGKLGGNSPQVYERIDGKRIRAVYCGGKHTCVLTEDLEVYTWGCNSSGQLGLSSTVFQY